MNSIKHCVLTSSVGGGILQNETIIYTTLLRGAPFLNNLNDVSRRAQCAKQFLDISLQNQRSLGILRNLVDKKIFENKTLLSNFEK